MPRYLHTHIQITALQAHTHLISIIWTIQNIQVKMCIEVGALWSLFDIFYFRCSHGIHMNHSLSSTILCIAVTQRQKTVMLLNIGY